jgi:hypothetical protein
MLALMTINPDLREHKRVSDDVIKEILSTLRQTPDSPSRKTPRPQAA